MVSCENEIGLLLKMGECEYLDFKREWHQNKIDLVHDLLCLANAYTNNDRYIIFGIDNDRNIIGLPPEQKRLKDNEIYDILKNKPRLNRIPTISVEEHLIDDKTIDLLIIRNRPDKPFFLLKDYEDKKDKKLLRAGVVYTRHGSRNTACSDDTAGDDQIELMYRERFALDKNPLERMQMFLNDLDFWRRSEDSFYYEKFPEFRVDLGETRAGFDGDWVKNGHFSDTENNSLISYSLVYHGTILAKVSIVALDGYRHFVPLPKLKGNEPTIPKDDFSYKVAKLIVKLTNCYKDPVEKILERCGIRVT